MAVPQILRRFIAPGYPERAVLYSVVLGAAALIDPATLTPGKRAAYRLGLAGITAATVAGDTPRHAGPVTRSALATAAGGAALGLSEASEALDGKMQRSLVKRGVRKPRLVFAAVTVALAISAELPALIAARRSARACSTAAAGTAVPGSSPGKGTDTNSEISPMTYAALPEGARAIITGMLDFSADPGSEALRTQLTLAQETIWGGVSGLYDLIEIDVEDAASLPRAVPHRQHFPVSASFQHPERGASVVARLEIEDGLLARLHIEAEDPAVGLTLGSGSLWPKRWPAIAEMHFAVESAAPLDIRAAKRARTASEQ